MSPRDEHENYPGLPRWILDAAMGPTKPPTEPSADIREAASSLRQMYTALCNEGFTDERAVQLIIGMMRSAK